MGLAPSVLVLIITLLEGREAFGVALTALLLGSFLLSQMRNLTGSSQPEFSQDPKSSGFSPSLLIPNPGVFFPGHPRGEESNQNPQAMTPFSSGSSPLPPPPRTLCPLRDNCLYPLGRSDPRCQPPSLQLFQWRWLDTPKS